METSEKNTMVDNAFIIAATSSGCGKTTLSLGLMRELTRRGHSVQPFKCGPDYIDTQFHGKATGNPSINLDTFMSSESHVKNLFSHYSCGKDVAVVEGVMGMFDGYSKMSGSSANISRILSIPVILLVNAASTAYSVAAVIYGFKNFKPDVKIAGVIFNRVASESHFSFLKDACKDAGVECLGYIRRDDKLNTPSRHLGLTLTAETEMENFINAAADAVADGVDIDLLLQLTKISDSVNTVDDPYASRQVGDPSLSENPRLQSGDVLVSTLSPGGAPCDKAVAVANDEAFNFIYPANIDRLRQLGYKIVWFSPIHDSKLPDADFVYLPGGYPELYANQISANTSMMESIGCYVEIGGKVWAECGGMIYLSKEIDDIPMCGIFPLKCTMKDAKLTLGYRTIYFGGMVFKGHEFHYSRVVNPECIESVAVQTNAKGSVVKTPVYRYKNVFASYTHLYWGDIETSLEYGC